MRKVAVVFLILLMTVTVSTLQEDPQNVNSPSQVGTSSFPIGISRWLLEEKTKSIVEKTEKQEELLINSDRASSIALPIGYVGAQEAIALIRREELLSKRVEELLEKEAQAKAKHEALLAKQEEEKLLVQQGKNPPPSPEKIKEENASIALMQIKPELISKDLEFINSSISSSNTGYAIDFVLKNIGNQLRVGTIHFTLHFADNSELDFSEQGSYRFKIQVPKKYNITFTQQMKDYMSKTKASYLTVSLKDDSGRIFYRKNFLF